MHIVKTKSKFLKVFIDSLIEIEYDIISANYLLCDRADDTLILKDIEVSTSLSMNKAWRSRLASVNFQIQDLGSSKPKFNQDDELLKLLRKRVGHAGVTVETTPEITNTLFDNHGWKDLNEIPHLPTFKNVERANTPITYPSN